MNKLDKISLIAAGTITFLAGLMHFSFFSLFSSELIIQSPDYQLIIHTLIAGSILLAFTVAYISVFHASDLMNTRIGKSLLISFAFLYIIRLVAEFVFATYEIFWIISCLILASVYMRVFIRSIKETIITKK